MNFITLAESRYSCRKYDSRAVSKEDIETIINCAHLAPSACNKQPWKIYIITDSKVKNDVAASYPREWFKSAPVIVVFCGLAGENWVREDGADYLLCDVAILADHFIYAAHSKGLGTCWVAHFDESVVRKALNLPENEIPIIMTPLGYAADTSGAEKKRKNVSDIYKII